MLNKTLIAHHGFLAYWISFLQLSKNEAEHFPLKYVWHSWTEMEKHLYDKFIFSQSISLHQASERLQCERWKRWTMMQDHLWTNDVRRGLKAALSVFRLSHHTR